MGMLNAQGLQVCNENGFNEGVLTPGKTTGLVEFFVEGRQGEPLLRTFVTSSSNAQGDLDNLKMKLFELQIVPARSAFIPQF